MTALVERATLVPLCQAGLCAVLLAGRSRARRPRPGRPAHRGRRSGGQRACPVAPDAGGVKASAVPGREPPGM